MSTCVSTLPSRLPVPLSATNCSKSYWVNAVGHVRTLSQYGAAESRESANAATGNSTRRHSNPKAARFMMDLPLIGRGIMRSIHHGCTEHFGNRSYSYRSASIGWREAAFQAGYEPKPMPIAEQTTRPVIAQNHGKTM